MSQILLAIGGPSGVGKTAVIAGVKRTAERSVVRHVEFTTRTRRPNEIDGMEYYFRTVRDLDRAKQDPKNVGFVNARDCWYWINLGKVHESIQQYPAGIHIMSISHVQVFRERKRLFPDLRWIWIDGSDAEIKQRLANRDERLCESLEYNRRLASEAVGRIVDLWVHNVQGELEAAVAEIISFCDALAGGK